ncbi:hypothetical protein [Pseudonocardia ammonioxydans]|uniref:hypothetical protein n=1 Tax=Pseudonocardia ammonioxydans TaxID=260086 RepID=UPI00116017EC|nr:hypothetical protein [Pseudonocardia ammonioxydans]
MDDVERRRRLVEAGHPAVTGPGRLPVSGLAGRDPGGMAEQSEQEADRSWPHPASERARESQTWRTPAEGYPVSEGGAGAWAEPDGPGQAPPPMTGTGVAYRVGWLHGTAGPDDGGPGAA